MKRALAAAVLTLLASCERREWKGPLRLVELKTTEGRLARVGALASGGDTRPALLESARYRVPLPKRARLTFGMGLAYAAKDQDEAPGWFHVSVSAGGHKLTDKQLNPRAAHGFRDVSLPLEGLGDETEIAFELRLTDRDGHDIPLPNDMLIGVAEPTVHDQDDYGRAKGVVLVSIDTVRRDHVSAYGYAKPTTPRFEAFSREGILCEDAVSTSSWTLPAHLSMLTSVDPGAHGGVDHTVGFNRKVGTLTSSLKKAGFATHAVTSHLYVSPSYGLDDGFESMDFRQDRRAADVADKAVALLDRFGDRPFFVFLHMYDPHWHYDPPEETRRLFEDDYKGPLTGRWGDFKDKARANTMPEELRHLLALYDGEIRYADQEVGRVLDHLKANGLDKSTLVVITSDHGEEFLDHGSWEHQKTLYEEVIRVPMAIRGPGIAPRRESAQVSLLDIAPTILAWAGLPALETAQGKSLLASPGEREAYGETDNTTDATRKLFLRAGGGRWKAVFSLSKDGKTLSKSEWFDLAKDAAEQHETPPRAEAAKAIEARAIGRWRDARGRGVGAPTVHLTPEQEERLKALGYIHR